ncbi:MAG TPA: NYN domain-containing protein [Gemmatimonadales bacterium]|nr:NYN domain-containing protein [Gemmatimonadales bacterium]
MNRPARHLTHVQPPVHAPNAALLIDFDNVTLGIRSDLTKELRTLLNSDIIKGKVAVQRAYADWRRYPQYIVPLSESSIDLIFAPAFGTSKKNATDIRLAIDAIELVFTRPEIGTFILLSGDSDFSTMVIKLKEYGKYVIGVGIRESASDLLIQNCDEYYSYNDLAGLTKEVEAPSIQRDPWELAQEAVAQMVRNGDVMRSDRLKQVMQQIDPNFDEKNAGFSRFSKFVLEAANKKLLQVTKLENGQYEVAPTGAVTVPPERTRGEREPREARHEVHREGREGREEGRRGRGRGRGRGREREREPREETRPAAHARPLETRRDGQLTLAQAFQLISQALSELPAPVPHEALRLRMVALHGREDPLLDEARFPRLLRQANDAEVADVRKVSETEYEVSPHRLDVAAAASARREVPAPGELSLPAAAEEVAGAAAAAAAPAAPTEAAGSANGARAGLRFRRGSRAPSVGGQIPLIGVVQIEPAVVEVSAPEAPAEAEPAEAPKAKGRGRSRARTRKPAAAASEAPAEAAAAPEPEAAPAAPARKRASRPRAKKKAE